MHLVPYGNYAGSVIDGTLYRTDRNGNPNVFRIDHDDNGMWLNNNWANPTNKWNPNNEFLFSLREYILFRIIRCGFSLKGTLNFSSILQTFFLLHQALVPYLQIVYEIVTWLPTLWK